MHSLLDSLADAITKARRVLVATHLNPDGDAVGSAVALAHIASHSGAEARIIFGAGLPDFLSWLPMPVPTVKTLKELGSWKPDLILVADCGEINRAEPDVAALLSEEFSSAKGANRFVVVNIDHHVSNPGFAHLNWVEPQRSATGEMVGILAEHMGIPLEGDLGQAIYLALVSDTGNFSFSNTGPDCLALAARLVACGLNIADFTAKYENTWNIRKMRLWGRLLSEVRLDAGGAVAFSVAFKKYLDEFGLTKADLDGFASWLRRLRGVRVGFFIREDSPSRCKISLRSMGDFDVQEVAALYGGGGHAAAAGAELSLPPEEAAAKVLADIKARFD